MRKDKTKNLLKILGSMLLVLVLVFSFVACDGTPATEGNEPTEEQEVITPVRNGSFEYFSGDAFPKAPANWTFTSEYKVDSSDSKTYSYRGVIDVSSANYDAEKYHLSANPGKVGDDNYVLMLNNVEKYSASYYSSVVTVEKGKYYKLTVNVKTADIATDSTGAYIYVLNGSNSTKNYIAKFESINSSEWTTYTSYIKASKSANTSVYVKVALGTGDKNSDTLSKGVAFFDEIDIVEIEESAYEAASKNDKTDKYNLTLPNAEFNNASSTSTTSTSTPYNWYTKRGADDNGENEAPTTGRSRGIIDINTYKATQSTGALKNVDVKTTIGLADGVEGSKVLMLYLYNEKSPTAHAYYSDAITFEAEKYYQLTFKLLTYGIKNKDEQLDSTKGVTVKLGTETLFENLNTDGEWVEYSICVSGSITQNKSQELYFWLGTGHEGDKSNYVSGAMFLDSLDLVEISESEFNNMADDEITSKIGYTAKNIISADDGYNIQNPFDGSLWTGEQSEDVFAPTTAPVLSAVNLANYPADKNVYGVENPDDNSTNRAGSDNALVIYNKEATAYTATFSNVFDIKANQSLRLSLWVKTYNVESGKGINVLLINVGEDGVIGGDDDTTISTLSAINTEKTVKDEDGEETIENKWTEIVFNLSGNQYKSNKFALKVVFGDGTRYASDNLLSGTVFMRNMFLEEMTYAEFSAVATSSTETSYTFRSNASSTIANGNFNYFDSEKSELDDNGLLSELPGVPSSWSGSYAKDDEAIKSVEVISGITNETVFNKLLTKNANSVGGLNVFPYNEDVIDTLPHISFNGAPNLLMIWNKGETAYEYTSSSTTLSANTYYEIRVNVKTNILSGNGAKITMKNGNKVTEFKDINGDWTTYSFFVEVGLNSSTLKLTLSLGDADALTSGVAFFDNVWHKTITEDEFNEATETQTVKKVSLTTDSFESSSDGVAKPSNFSGGAISSAPSGNKYTQSGVINFSHIDEDVKNDFDIDDNMPAPHGGNEYLVIYNMGDENNGAGTAYAYTSSAYTFSAKSHYKVSVWARVYKLGESDKANITLTLSDTDNSAFEVTNANEWKLYTFFVKMDDADLSKVTLKLGLGQYNLDENDVAKTSDYAVGYALFDDVTIEKITEDEFTAGEETAKTDAFTNSINVKANNADDEDETPEEEEIPGPDAGTIIAIVSASILSVALVAVLVIIFVKKISPSIKEKKRKKYKKPGYGKRTGTTSKNDLDKFKD